MGIIRELPRGVIEKIAAGEVVERPASVVKELVENAIDAGATSIRIDLEDGGRRRIAVVDDGSGMDADDLARSVERHATSKITEEADLWGIRTMGFRGEALAAIGAVSRLAIESKPNRSEVIEGARLRVIGGQIEGPASAGCPGGTKVEVADLFFNVPARQKFLRSGAVEFGHAFDAVASLSLASPDIRFELSADGRRRFLSAAGDIGGRVGDILGEALRGRLRRLEEGGDALGISGWVAEGGRSGARDLHLFINRRPVRDKLLMHAVTAGFGEALPRGQYPAAVLMIEIDPTRVDVNVHPTKREVRFADGRAVHDFVLAAVRKALGTPAVAPFAKEGMSTAASLRFEVRHETRDARRETELPLTPPLPVRQAGSPLRGEGFAISFPSPLWGEGQGEGVVVSLESRVSSLASEGRLRPLGQLGSTYVVCEGRDGSLVLIDQHAAHERLGFDELRRRHAQGFVPQQVLLVPERVELGPTALAYVAEHRDALEQAGFEIEPFGGATLIVKAVPELLGDQSVAGLFDRIASELEELGGAHSVEEEVERIFAVVACHAQVRAGDRLSPEELSALVRDVEREGVTHCPHGRPAVVRIEKGEIERWFKRRG